MPTGFLPQNKPPYFAYFQIILPVVQNAFKMPKFGKNGAQKFRIKYF